MDSLQATISFFNAENCLYVHRQLRSAAADEIRVVAPSCRTYLTCCPPRKAKSEFAKELNAMHRLCVDLMRR